MYYRDRDEMATGLINYMEYARGIEVGVREGYFSRLILEGTAINLSGVDISLLPSAIRLVDEFPGRYSLSAGRSPECSSRHPDSNFDFVHIDADHSYAAVAADLEAWWPKVMLGGAMTGDDYADTINDAEGAYGVVRAVNEFADRRGLKLRVTGVPGTDREAHLAFAKFNGEQATRFLSRVSYEPFQNPGWYLFKTCSAEQ